MSQNILQVISKELIDRLELKPLVGDQVVEFRLLRAGVLDPSSTRAVATPAYQGLAPYCEISDPYDKFQNIKRIANITGYTPIRREGLETVYEPKADYVRFLETGRIEVRADQNDLYYFLKLHNKNISNPNRRTRTSDGRGIPGVYFEVDVKKDIKLKNDLFDYTFLASKVLYEADEDQIFDIALKLARAFPEKYSFSTTSSVDALKNGLQLAVKNDALNFILTVKEAFSYTRVLVDDAVARKQIFFDDNETKLAWSLRRDDKKPKQLVKLEKGLKPVDGLVNHLISPEGSENMVEIRQLYEENYKKK